MEDSAFHLVIAHVQQAGVGPNVECVSKDSLEDIYRIECMQSEHK